MKKNILVAASVAAAGLAFYITQRKKNSKSNKVGALESKPSHHVTDIFARAKEKAVK